jgi:hypothetical protein
MERDSLAAAMEAGDGTDIWIRIADTEGRETFASVQDQIPFSGQEWTVVPAYVPPADVRRIREFDPRALLGQIYAAMTRRIR